MTYTPNIPLTGQSLGITKNPINSNFQQINTVFGVNHVAFNATGQGKHTFVEMPNQSGKPATIANECGIYAANVAGQSQIIYRPENQALNAGNIYQLTRDIPAQYSKFGTTTVSGDNTYGWTFLPGNLIFMYGSFAQASGISGSPTFPFSFTTLFSLNVSVKRGAAVGIIITASTTSGFSYAMTETAANAYTVYWQAIGV